MSEDAMEQMSFLFNEAEVYNDAVKAEEESTPVAAHKRHKKHEYTLDNIPKLNRSTTVWWGMLWYAPTFDEAMKSLPKGKAKNSSAAQGLAYCTMLFEIEKSLETESPEQRYKQRLEQAKPVLDALLAWANVRNAAPKSSLGKALTYLRPI